MCVCYSVCERKREKEEEKEKERVAVGGRERVSELMLSQKRNESIAGETGIQTDRAEFLDSQTEGNEDGFRNQQEDRKGWAGGSKRV